MIRPSHIALFLVVAFAYLLLSPFNISDGYYHWLDVDYGILTENAFRVLKGEALYRDVWSIYGPATDHFNAFIFWLLGANVWSLRIVLALSGAVTALLVFFSVGKLSSVRYAVAATFLAFLIGPVCLNFPYPSWFCIPLGLSMVLLEHEGWQNDRKLLRLLAGGVAGLIFLFKANWGIFAFVALVNIQCCGALLVSREGPRSAAVKTMDFAVVVTMLCSLPVMSLILLKEHLTVTNMLIFFLPTCAVLAVGISLRERSLGNVTSFQALTPVLCSSCGFAALVLPVTAYYFHQLGPAVFYTTLIYPSRVFSAIAYFPFLHPAPLAAFMLVFLFMFQGILILLKEKVRVPVKTIFLCVLWVFLLAASYQFIHFLKENTFKPMAGYLSSGGWPFRLACYIPVSIHLGLGFVFMKDSRMPILQDRRQMHLSLSLWIYSMAVFLVFYPVMDIYHLIWVFTPVLILGTYFLFRSARFWDNKSADSFGKTSSGWLKAFSTLLFPILFGAFLALPFFKYFIEINRSPFRIARSKFSDIESDRARILMPPQKAADLSDVVRAIESKSSKDDFLFDMTGSYFNFLADRKTPVGGRTNFFPGLSTPQDVAEVEIRLLLLKPRIVVSSIEADKVYSCYYPEIHRMIISRYKPAGSYGPFIVRTLKEKFL